MEACKIMSDLKAIIPVILSGGSGTRLWPMSREERPKQMLALTAEDTMLQLTARRTKGVGYAAPIVVANGAHADLVSEQLAAAGACPQALILEPVGRNTAPAIALAALAAGGGDDPLLVMPSDHVISDVPAFHRAIESARAFVDEGWLVTFGIEVEGPETGYGWIRIGEAIGCGIHRVDRFVEKPALEQAKKMQAEGNHAWNGGIFMFRADCYLEALAQYAPEMLAAARLAMEKAERDGVRVWPDGDSFAASPANSIDYTVMEKAPRVAVVPAKIGWSDVGSWDALHAISLCDASGNACRGNVVAIETENCFVRAGEGRRVVLVGVSDLIVVADGDDILILPRGRSQEVKKVTEAMKK